MNRIYPEAWRASLKEGDAVLVSISTPGQCRTVPGQVIKRNAASVVVRYLGKVDATFSLVSGIKRGHADARTWWKTRIEQPE